MFWIPEFLTRERGLNLAGITLVAWIPFLVADVSNFGGGYLSLRLQQAGWSVNRTRKTMMVLAVVFSPMAILAVLSHSLFWTIPTPGPLAQSSIARTTTRLCLSV